MHKLLTRLIAVVLFVPLNQARADSLGHDLLVAEFEATGQSKAEYQTRLERLDLLTSQVLARIKPNPDLKSESDARSILGTIDTVLAENDYQIWIPSDSLWDALAKNKGEKGLAYSKAMRKRQKEHGEAYTAKYVLDCDTGSFIYLHILEQISAPVCLVETKGHNFVRWRFSDTRYLNWDVNSGDAFEDEDFRKGGVGLSRGFSKEEEEAEGYLQDISRQELLAYHLQLVAKLYEARRDFEKAVDTYMESIRCTPNKPAPRNNLAWMIAVEPALQQAKFLDLALTEATQAVELRPLDGNYIDTLAATYAARRDFANALKWERSEHGNKNRERIAIYEERKKTPAELGWK